MLRLCQRGLRILCMLLTCPHPDGPRSITTSPSSTSRSKFYPSELVRPSTRGDDLRVGRPSQSHRHDGKSALLSTTARSWQHISFSAAPDAQQHYLMPCTAPALWCTCRGGGGLSIIVHLVMPCIKFNLFIAPIAGGWLPTPGSSGMTPTGPGSTDPRRTRGTRVLVRAKTSCIAAQPCEVPTSASLLPGRQRITRGMYPRNLRLRSRSCRMVSSLTSRSRMTSWNG